jgi:hypothetical protein
MNNLPSSDKLLPGSAPFDRHPGYTAHSCELRETVVAQTYATNNGFRCYMTGGHCVPGAQCEDLRVRHKEHELKFANAVPVVPFSKDLDDEFNRIFFVGDRE